MKKKTKRLTRTTLIRCIRTLKHYNHRRSQKTQSVLYNTYFSFHLIHSRKASVTYDQNIFPSINIIISIYNNS